MKLTFSWHPSLSGDPFAICQADHEVAGEVSPVACVLADDGGLDHATSLLWVDEGIRRAVASLAGAPDYACWARETFAADIGRDATTVYHLLVESCSETLPTRAFLRALREWRAFLADGPSSQERSVDLDDI